MHPFWTWLKIPVLVIGVYNVGWGQGRGGIVVFHFVVCFCQMSHPLSNRIQQKKKILTVPRLCRLKVVSYCSACFRMMSYLSIYLFSVDRVWSTSSWMPSPTGSCWLSVCILKFVFQFCLSMSINFKFPCKQFVLIHIYIPLHNCTILLASSTLYCQ